MTSREEIWEIAKCDVVGSWWVGLKIWRCFARLYVHIYPNVASMHTFVSNNMLHFVCSETDYVEWNLWFLQYCQIGFNKSTSHVCQKISIARMIHNWNSKNNSSKVFYTHQWPLIHVCRHLVNFKIWYVFLGITIFGLTYPFLGVGGGPSNGLKRFTDPCKKWWMFILSMKPNNTRGGQLKTLLTIIGELPQWV